MCTRRRLAGEGGHEQSGKLVVPNAARPAGTQLIIESSRAMLDTALPPLAHGGVSPAQAAGDLGVALALYRPQHQSGPRHQSVWQSAGSGQTAQLGLFVGGKTQGGLGASDGQARSLSQT